MAHGRDIAAKVQRTVVLAYPAAPAAMNVARCGYGSRTFSFVGPEYFCVPRVRANTPGRTAAFPRAMTPACISKDTREARDAISMTRVLPSQ